MSEMVMGIDKTLLDEDNEWPDQVTFELQETGETRTYVAVTEQEQSE
jgi:hypothetical protein